MIRPAKGEMHMRRKLSWSLFFLLIICIFVSAGCSSSKSSINVSDIVNGIDEETARKRYDAMTGNTEYISYSVYKELSETEMEKIGQETYEMLLSQSEDDLVSKCSLAFYKEDSRELLHAFLIDKNGINTDVEDSQIVPGNSFSRFKPEG